MAPTLPAFAELQAPARWSAIDFISDLHLQSGEPATVAAWERYMAHTPAQAVFILGDLFEVWVGDDAAAPGSFEARCAATLRDASRTRDVFFMHGNRDFLLGETFAGQSGMTLLQDPTALLFNGQRWLLSHGDALCLDDHDYMAFRAQVRTPGWQHDFLAQPLEQRRDVARGIRSQSEARKQDHAVYADLDPQATLALMQMAQAPNLIHGHTHRPADHAMDGGRTRIVLSDWDAAATPARLEVLRLTATGAMRMPVASACA